MLSEHSAIGIFDSGVGGLSVLKKVQQALPNENLIYFADSANAPYGNKEESFIQQRALAIAEFLAEQHVKAIVLACNTATAAAANILRQHLHIPVIALEPAIKPAVLKSQNKVVAVLATSGTINSKKYQLLKSQYRGKATIIDIPGCGLVEYIEAGKQDTVEFYQLLASYLQVMQNYHADSLVLGCTHYPFAKKWIKKIVAHEINILDSGKAVAQELTRQLEQQGLLRDCGESGEVSFYANKTNTGVVARLWGGRINLQVVNK